MINRQNKNIFSCALVLFFGTTVSAWAEKGSTAEKQTEQPAKTPASPLVIGDLVDGLDQANLQEAFRLLRSEYIKQEDLSHLEINRAALQGMLSRMKFGAMLLTEKSRSDRNSRFQFYKEKINKTTAYIRFGKYRKEELAELDKSLNEFNKDQSIETLIMDLRSPQRQAEFAIAGEILSRFVAPSELLFKIRRPGNDRPTLFVSKAVEENWRRELILLVDRETGNIAEIIAAVLDRKQSCLILGEKTPGLTVEYRDVPIGQDRILRYAIAEVVLDDDTSLFQKGVEPDITTPTLARIKHTIFAEVEKEKYTLRYFLYPKQRPRRNEAALVAGTNPELGYMLLRSARKPTPWDEEIPKDRALLQAVDLLNTMQFLQEEEAEE